jgi:NAD(P)-dependent dehydrogenase (short-subunit alcohol dehydrogenase family)
VRLAGKRAIITGAGSGIGRAAAIRFALEGASVAVLDIDEPAATHTVALIEASGGDAVALVADISVEHDIEAATAAAAARFGGLDIVVANAAIEPTAADDRADRLDMGVWRRIIDINLTGTFLTCKYGVRRLLEYRQSDRPLRPGTGRGCVQREQGRCLRTDPRDGERLRIPRDSGERRDARVHRHPAHPCGGLGRAATARGARGSSAGTHRSPRRGRGGDGLPRIGRRFVCDWRRLGGGRRHDGNLIDSARK